MGRPTHCSGESNSVAVGMRIFFGLGSLSVTFLVNATPGVCMGLEAYTLDLPLTYENDGGKLDVVAPCMEQGRRGDNGVGVWGLGFGVWGLGFGVWGLGWALRFGVWGLGLGWGFGLGVWVGGWGGCELDPQLLG